MAETEKPEFVYSEEDFKRVENDALIKIKEKFKMVYIVEKAGYQYFNIDKARELNSNIHGIVVFPNE